MSMNKLIRGLGTVSALAIIGGCHSLEIANPNDPNAQTALSDPSAVEALGAGSLRVWSNAYTGLRSAGVLSAQARTYSASWNNGNLNFYSGIDISPTDTSTSPDTWTRNTRSWQNDPASAARTSVDAFWGGGLDESATPRPGVYAALSAANSALLAIRKNGLVVGDAAQTKRLETFAQFMQGAALMVIALNYDKGYVVDEKSDLTTLAYVDRKVMRDSAISKLKQAVTLATANTFTTPTAWTNNGPTFTNVQLAKVANTMLAMTLGWYPREDTENIAPVMSAADWAQVATYASAGMSSGGSNVEFYTVSDGYSAWISEIMGFGLELLDTGRLSTRVAHMLDPATQKDPYPLGIGNPQPNSLDKRLGDGSFGVASMQSGFGNVPKTANAGTDFAWSSQGEIMRPDRGYYHQSNIGHIRYDASGVMSPTDIYGGFGKAPLIGSVVNDLLWAEGLLRSNAAVNLAQIVTLINKTRVTRGGLPAATVADAIGADTDGPCMATGVLVKNGGACTLWSKLLYEYEIELLGFGPAPFYNQRHLPVLKATAWEKIGTGIFNGPRYIQGLLPGTPREMPVPYKELGVKGEALYTWGGSAPAHSPAP